jgi:hypothetical protein
VYNIPKKRHKRFKLISMERKMKKFLRSKTPVILAAAVSFLLSVYLWFGGYKDEGLFVGLWVPSILSLGAFIYAGRSSS